MPRRGMQPITSIKHYVQRTNTAIASGARTSFVIIQGVVAPAASATSDVREGASVTSVFIEIWIKGTGASDADTQFNVLLEKVDGAAAAGASFSDMGNMMAYDNKKNILFAGQGVVGGVGGGQAIPIMRGWYKIPRGKSRWGLGDFLQVSVSTTGEGMQMCGLATYKEFR